MKEKEIVHTAIENLEPGLDLRVQWQPYVDANRKVDANYGLMPDKEGNLFAYHKF